MQKRYKKLTACALVLLLGLTCAVSPVCAAEETGTNMETGELQEIDETAVPISDTEGTNVEGGTDTEENKKKETTDTENSEEKEITDIEEVTENQNTKTENPVSLFSTASTAVPLATEDTIEIGTAQKLIDFATKINNGTYSTDTNAILTANIDMTGKTYTPIGTYSKQYSGTFDGQGNTVTFKISSTDNDIGLFGYINGATIQNVGVAGTISTTINYAGGIVADVYGNSTIKGCWNEAEIKASNYVGGIAGYIDRGSNVKIENCYNTGAVTANSNSAGGIAGEIKNGSVTNCYNTGTVTARTYAGGIAGDNDGSITNCYNTGTVTANSYYAGGIAGGNDGSITNCYNTGTVTANSDYAGGIAGDNDGSVTNCYNTGTVTASRDGGGIAGRNYGSVTNCYNTGTVTVSRYGGGIAGYNYSTGSITNCYYLSGSSNSAGGGTSKTEAKFKSGEVTWLLNSSTSEGVWKQTLGTEDSPNFDGLAVYMSAEGVYANIVISNEDELIDFATKINNGAYSADTNAILTADIEVTGTYTPIGTYDKQYSGTFEGNGKTVTLNISSNSNDIGLFGYINGATIQNVGVAGTISTTANDAGGIVANVYVDSTIKGCWNEAEIKANNYAGGIAGYIDRDSNVKIENCYNTGAVTANSSYAGGIVSYIDRGSNVKIENCYNTGAVTAMNGSYAGGIAGNNDSGSITNCYNTGAVTVNSRAGGIAGYNNGSITNCYYLEGSSSSAGGGTLKTETEFKSGEVTWLLNEEKSAGVWKQTLETNSEYSEVDNYPVFNGRTVYEIVENGVYANTETISAPTPEFTTSKKTASSITLSFSNYNSTYGTVQYSLDSGTTWQSFETTGEYKITDLKAGQTYNVSVKYAGAGNYLESDIAQESVTTNSASYTITIPSTTLTAGESNSSIAISADTSESFDLGYGGTVTVKVKNNGSVSSDGKLTLTRNVDGAANTITSALLVNGSPFTNIADPIITFTMDDYNSTDKKATISFAEPLAESAEAVIPAGDYKGTITFEISYSEN